MVRKLIIKVLGLLSSYRLPPASEAESLLLAELKTAFLAIQPLPVDPASRTAEGEWASNVNKIRDQVLDGDPRRFLRWDVVLYTMFPVLRLYTLKELRCLRALPDWRAKWRDAVRESVVGYPIRCAFYPRTSSNIIHLAYHLAWFERVSRKQVEKMDVVVEFGGGYGCLCRLMHRLGFSGKYVILDLPAFSAIQKYYLKAEGLPVLDLDEFVRAERGVLCVTSVEEVRQALKNAAPPEKSLFIATWSLSETPLAVREKIVPELGRFGNFLVAYQHQFNEIDNVGYFEQFQNARPGLIWNGQQIAHMGKNSYLTGYSR